MNITELTPNERRFSVELTENEVKLLGIVLGRTVPTEIEQCVDSGFWYVGVFPGVKFEDYFIQSFYDKLVALFKS